MTRRGKRPSVSLLRGACRRAIFAFMRIRTISAKAFVGSKSDIPIALRAAYLALHRCSDAAFAAQGITADQFVLLATLARGDALTQRELARRMSSDPSTVRAMLVLLERLGLVKREGHPTDARARTVALTAAGKRKFRKLWAAGEPIRSQMFDALNPGEAPLLVQLLNRIATALNEASISVGQPPSFNSHEVEP